MKDTKNVQPGRRQQIMQAALRVFARLGFHEASTKEIAAEAGLKSPALLYWYFKDKQELFESILLEMTPLTEQVSNFNGQMDLPPEEALTSVARVCLSAFDDPDVARLFRVFISDVSRGPEASIYFVRSGMNSILDYLVSYFQRQVELGRLRPHDAQSSARSFVGMLITYVLGRDIFPGLGPALPSAAQYIQDIVALFLNGLRCHPAGAT